MIPTLQSGAARSGCPGTPVGRTPAAAVLPTSLSRQLVRQEGYPPELAGFGPDEPAYWTEPGLGWVGAQPDQAGPASLAPLLVGPFLVWNDEMAPRFLSGTTLAGRRLAGGDPVAVGQVLAWFAPGTLAGCFRLARVQAVAAGHLLLRPDNGGRGQELAWEPGAGPERVYLITHYIRQPFQWARLRLDEPPRPTDEDYLLEVADRRMGPRYPVGARYRCRPVPRTGWAAAWGVHALRLRDGRELLARLLSRCGGDVVVSFDGAGQLERVALADVQQLWQVGAADYLPEETLEEHQAMLHRRGY